MEILTILKYLLAADSLVIIVAVLLQARSGGLGTMFGGSGGGETYRAKRGMEAVLYNVTVVAAVVFAVLALGIAIVSV